MRYVILMAVIVAWLGVMAPAAQACRCVTPGPPCDSYGTASAVFVGTATSVRRAEPAPEGSVQPLNYSRVFKFSVDQAYLGVAGTEIEVVTGSGGGDCGYDFNIGERYLVYAYLYQNTLSASICSRTRPFTQANEDLAFLGNLSSAARGATIYGQVIREQMAKNEVPSLPSDVVVAIEGPDVRREIRPDAQGRYRVSGLPPGKFKVTLQLPETLFAHLPERELTVADRGCGAVTYHVTDNGRLTGRVFDAEGQPIPRIMISLIDPASDPKKDSIKLERTDEEGRFNLSAVPPGRYLIAVNHYRFGDPNDPTLAYPAVFYPGVVDQPNAEVITLAAGEKRTGLDVRVPLRRPASIVSGQVVWADGSPVANASLSLRDITHRESGVSYGAQADENGRFTINGYVGQKLLINASSNRPYVPLGARYEPMERSEQVRITLEKPQETIRVVITKLR